MKLFLFVTFLICFVSCSEKSATGKQLAGSDSLVINFNEPQTNNIAKTVTTTEDKAIEKLVGFVDNKTSEAYKCGYDGNLLFYKKGKIVADVSFNYSGDGCRHFIQDINGELSSTAMHNEAADFLKSLAEGKDWY
ncbi:MAG: hypothetical protein KAY50_03960 [Chitinophagaceae bacterium]|nr:hypothetical protein [Chitinophagaceae bacterium]